MRISKISPQTLNRELERQKFVVELKDQTNEEFNEEFTPFNKHSTDPYPKYGIRQDREWVVAEEIKSGKFVAILCFVLGSFHFDFEGSFPDAFLDYEELRNLPRSKVWEGSRGKYEGGGRV